MPQLALESYASQYFWLLVIFFSFYYLSITQIIPRISTIMKSREKISEHIADQKGSEESKEGVLGDDTSYEIVSEKAYNTSNKWGNYLKKWLDQEKSRISKGKKKIKISKKAKARAAKQKQDRTTRDAGGVIPGETNASGLDTTPQDQKGRISVTGQKADLLDAASLQGAKVKVSKVKVSKAKTKDVQGAEVKTRKRVTPSEVGSKKRVTKSVEKLQTEDAIVKPLKAEVKTRGAAKTKTPVKRVKAEPKTKK